MQKHRPRAEQRECYIVFFQYSEPHDRYPSLCKPCADFNIAESNLSLPGNLNLSGKTALVTGGRANSGFATAIRLLRCGEESSSRLAIHEMRKHGFVRSVIPASASGD